MLIIHSMAGGHGFSRYLFLLKCVLALFSPNVRLFPASLVEAIHCHLSWQLPMISPAFLVHVTGPRGYSQNIIHVISAHRINSTCFIVKDVSSRSRFFVFAGLCFVLCEFVLYKTA